MVTLHANSVPCAGHTMVHKPSPSLSHGRRVRQYRSKLSKRGESHKGSKQDRMENSMVVKKSLRKKHTSTDLKDFLILF